MPWRVALGVLVVVLIAGLVYAAVSADLLGILMRMHGASPGMH